MRRKKRCRYCPSLFTPDARSYRSRPLGKGRRSAQIACSKPCQRQRHRGACRRWHIKNAAYDDPPLGNHPKGRRSRAAYMRDYRANHPDYVRSNRAKQCERDAGRKNLVTRDAIKLFSVGKVRGLIDLVTRDATRVSPVRVSEEIVRVLERANRLVTRDAIALQKKIEHNRGHETSATA